MITEVDAAHFRQNPGEMRDQVQDRDSQILCTGGKGLLVLDGPWPILIPAAFRGRHGDRGAA